MTVYELVNDNIAIKVKTSGAELISLKRLDTDVEYMWDGNSDYWGRVSPVLFPFIGKLKNQQYTYKGKIYNPKPHGFARDMEFKLENRTDKSLVFSIEENEETMKVYPFKFKFYIIYEIENNQVKVSFKVINKDKEKMYFSLGAHPGFKCPLIDREKRKDYYLGFEGKDTLNSRIVNIENGLVTNQYVEINLENGLLSIDDDLFAQDALVIEEQINQVSLYNSEKEKYLTLKMDAPVYGIWSAAIPAAPFVCIEPWFGRCDAEDFDGELEEREYQNELEALGEFETSYIIEV